MKKILNILIIGLIMQFSLSAQDFVLNNPVMTPNPGIFPGGTETMTFDFYVAGAPFMFSSNDLSNDYATITFSFTKMNPTGIPPTGTGAALFTWVLSNNGATGISRVYTWTGRSRDVAVNQTPIQPKYKIIFSNVPITDEATPSQTDVRVAGQFTDPGNAPTGNSGNNSAVIATYTFFGGPPLPISLLDFTATKQTSTVKLDWKSSLEINSKEFEVQYSTDAVSWKTIATLAAAGNSSVNRSYSYIHSNPVKGINYYRLNMKDISSSSKLSEIRQATFSDAGVVRIWPNPTTDRIFINNNQNSVFELVAIYSSDGKQLQQFSKFNAGNSIDMSSFEPGIYFIKITDKAGNSTTSRIVKVAK